MSFKDIATALDFPDLPSQPVGNAKESPQDIVYTKVARKLLTMYNNSLAVGDQSPAIERIVSAPDKFPGTFPESPKANYGDTVSGLPSGTQGPSLAQNIEDARREGARLKAVASQAQAAMADNERLHQVQEFEEANMQLLEELRRENANLKASQSVKSRLGQSATVEDDSEEQLAEIKWQAANAPSHSHPYNGESSKAGEHAFKARSRDLASNAPLYPTLSRQPTFSGLDSSAWASNPAVKLENPRAYGTNSYKPPPEVDQSTAAYPTMSGALPPPLRRRQSSPREMLIEEGVLSYDTTSPSATSRPVPISSQTRNHSRSHSRNDPLPSVDPRPRKSPIPRFPSDYRRTRSRSHSSHPDLSTDYSTSAPPSRPQSRRASRSAQDIEREVEETRARIRLGEQRATEEKLRRAATTMYVYEGGGKQAEGSVGRRRSSSRGRGSGY
ncbi:hypothetical protein GLAREA_10458 [Glarea lozoyensis ATCC 20868]|uniref:Uncharacterized protein n=1 Tax=Glarea lozoyensis (strain ATCC 20868 / MF5171) TaxID=1116229 RepID=S3E924_GLAL2|nr:uncharacterized protein GLAREA_10458 [Glarea lozoyensis ATCC 20868]EPE34763.1 hypothetical protein GLAREA_10458 [Glarea lozoyensis ATCC 20868]